MPYLKRSTRLIRSLYPGLIWDMRPVSNEVYLTFDDGPHPVVTPWVIEQLKQYQASATFFCIGQNVMNHPALFHELNERHTTGNHTMHHAKGWKTATKEYLHEVNQAASLIPGKWFRPPYGKIKFSQIRALHAQGYRIVMWSHLSGDFDVKPSSRKSFIRWMNSIQPGAIITFHDSQKAFPKLRWMLPLLLETLQQRGLTFAALKA